MGTPADYTYVRKGQVTVEVGASSETTQGSVHSLGCISGDFTVNDSFNEETAEEFDNWCAHIAAEANPGTSLAQVALGQRVIEFSADMEMDLADPNYAAEYNAYKAKTARQFQFTWENEAGDKQELFVNGVYTSWDRTARDGDGGAGTTRVNVGFHANAVVLDNITATSGILSVVVTPASASIHGAGTSQLTAAVTVTGGAAQTVTWTSSDTGVATVNGSGLVTAVANGSTTITATSTVDGTVSGTAAVTVTGI